MDLADPLGLSNMEGHQVIRFYFQVLSTYAKPGSESGR